MNEQIPSPSTSNKARGKARIRGLNIFPVKINGVDLWRVQTPMTDGKRWVKTFRSEKEARTFYDAQHSQLKIAGTAGLGLRERQRVDALAALEILSPFGVTLEQAAQAYAQSHEAVSESRPVAQHWLSATGARLDAKTSRRIVKLIQDEL